MADGDTRRVERQRFEDLYREHCNRVAGYLLARADRELASEALSRTFEVAWRRISDVPDEPLPWLLGVARKVLADLRRAGGRQDALIDRIAASGGDWAVDYAEVLITREGALAALARLTEFQREVLLLIAWDGSQREAAAVLGCSKFPLSRSGAPSRRGAVRARVLELLGAS